MKELLAIQQELKAPKGQFNSFGGYKYRSAEDILEAVKPLIGKYKCVLTLSDDIIHVGDRYYVKAVATLTSEAGQFSVSAFAREAENKKGMDDSQVTGTASSYARKYALNGLFAIDDTKDADTDEYAKRTGQTKPDRKQEAKPDADPKYDPNRLADEAERKTFRDLCQALEVHEIDILNSIGWTGGKMTYGQYGLCMKRLKEISDAVEKEKKHSN